MGAVFIGIGGTGDWILTLLKDKLRASRGELPEDIQFRLLDTLAADARLTTAAKLSGRVGIGVNEYVQLADDPPGIFFQRAEQLAHRRAGDPAAGAWFRADLFQKQLGQADFNLERGAGQHRQFGRMGVFLNRSQIATMIRRALELAAGPGEVPIWIVGSVAGGTGAGTFLDVAALARHVADDLNISQRVLGVAILPDVFGDVGIDQARGYAVLREFERFQAPVAPEDYGRDARSGREFRFAIEYDGGVRVLQRSTLFDNLVFYNRRRNNGREREDYFSQIADGLNLLLDSAVGNKLFNEWINVREGYAASFATTRVFLPARLYEREFVAEAMLEIARDLLPRDEASGAILAGAADDRQAQAREWLAEQNFPLFNAFLKLQTESDVERLDRELTPLYVVNTLLGFGNALAVFGNGIGDAERLARLLYRDLTENLETCREVKESFEDSKTRVRAEVARRRALYEGDGEQSFAAALAPIRSLVWERLHQYLDESLRDYVGGSAAQNQGLGRALRVLRETKSLLLTVRENRLKVVRRDRSELERLKGEESAALEALNGLRKPFFGFGSLAELEESYFSAVNAANRRWQRIKLNELLEELVQLASARVDHWLERLGVWEAAIDRVQKHGEDTLGETNQELERQIQSTSSALGHTNSKDMGGYQAVLRKRCLLDPTTGDRLPATLLAGLTWRLRPEQGGLVLEGWPGVEALAERDFGTLLRQRIADHVGAQMKIWEGMARYLEWLREEHPGGRDKLTAHLKGVANDFVDGQATSDKRRATLLYGDTWNPALVKGDDEFRAIHRDLSDSAAFRHPEDNVKDTEGRALFHDRNVLAFLLADKEISYQSIPVVERMRNEYLRVRRDPAEAFAWRTETYHLFRCEQEIWAIERARVRATGNGAVPLTSGSFYRLLDEPERVKMFLQALVTGVVRQKWIGIDKVLWVCGPPDSSRPVELTGEGEDLLRALITFVQDKKDRRPGSVGNLDLRTVESWVLETVQASGKSFAAIVAEFRQNNAELLDLSEQGGEYIDPRRAFIALVLDYYLPQQGR